MRVVALSGGYTRDDACQRLAHNHGMIASFSRALTEGLKRSMSEAEFDKALGDGDRRDLQGLSRQGRGLTARDGLGSARARTQPSDPPARVAPRGLDAQPVRRTDVLCGLRPAARLESLSEGLQKLDFLPGTVAISESILSLFRGFRHHFQFCGREIRPKGSRRRYVRPCCVEQAPGHGWRGSWRAASRVLSAACHFQVRFELFQGVAGTFPGVNIRPKGSRVPAVRRLRKIPPLARRGHSPSRDARLSTPCAGEGTAPLPNRNAASS